MAVNGIFFLNCVDEVLSINSTSTIQRSELTGVARCVDKLWCHADTVLFTALAALSHPCVILHVEVERWFHVVYDVRSTTMRSCHHGLIDLHHWWVILV